MPNFCQVQIVGNLGRDPEYKSTTTGKTYCSFSVASNKAGADRTETMWFRVTVWGAYGEWCANNLHKGSLVFVQGRLSERVYEKDGKEGRSLEVSATEVQKLDPREAEAVGVAAAADASDLPF